MKVICKVSEKLTFELDCNDQKDTFLQLSNLQEIFSEDTCGACGSKEVRFVVRTVDGNSFYEIMCQKCRSKLSFGSHRLGGTLFPHRKNEDGSWIDNKGWVRYVPPAK